jgi:MFS family permease
LAALLVFVLGLSIYTATLAPSITWRFSSSDSGELAIAAFSWGVAHPTGYPTWTLLGFLVTRLPWGDVAGRTNLMSALFGAGAAAFVVGAVMRLGARLTPKPAVPALLIAAATSGLAVVSAPAVWSQSIVTEVYSLNCLLLAILLWLISGANTTGNRLAACFLCGLALTNHLTALFLVVPALLLIAVRTWRSRAPIQEHALLLAALLLPLLLYLLIPWRAGQHPLENWGDPQTFGRFVRHVTGSEYHYLLQWRDLAGAVTAMPAIVRLFVAQFAWWVLPLSLYGLLRVRDVDPLFAVALIAAAAAYALFTAFYRGEGAQYYLLPAYLIEATLLGAGLAAATVDLAGWRPLAQLAPGTRLGLLLLLALFTIVPRAIQQYPELNERNDHDARNYARKALGETSTGGTFRSGTDEQTFALWYEQRIEGYRADVRVVDVRLAQAR